MPAPRHIQQQIDAGKAAFATQHEEPPAGALEGAPGGEPGDGTYDPPVIRDPAPGAAEDDQGPIRPPVGEPPAEEAGDDDPLAKAKHAVATWKGRYNADVRKLREQVEGLTELTNKQMTAIAGLQAQLVREPATPASNVTAVEEPVVTREEREQYGNDFSDYMERLARQAVQKQMTDLSSKVDTVRGAVEQVDRRTRETIANDFYRDLGRLCPNYAEIDEDPEFGEWLSKVDTYSGDSRKNLLVKACREADSQRAARFFLGFLAEQEATNPQKGHPTPAHGGNAGGNPLLERMASPGRPRQPASREAPAPEKVTEDQARTFYSDLTKGRYRNRPAERADMTRRIEAALLGGTLTLQ